MEEKKTHVSAWIKNRNLKEISANMKLIDCESRSEYIDKAVEHYRHAFFINIIIDVSSMRIVKNPYPAVTASGSIKPVCDIANTEISAPIAIITMSFSSHIHITAFDFKLSGY